MSDGQVLEFSGVTKQYGKVTAVSDFSAKVLPGRVTGFLGPNGAGKTTTLRILLGLVSPTSGSATVGGTKYRDLKNPTQVVGGALEANTFHPGRTAKKHLEVYAQAASISTARVAEVLELVGLTDAADRKVGGFSLGMRQRLAIATALLGDPGVLILDEPSNGLDPEGIKWMRSFLSDRAKEGRTVLVSSHMLGEVAQIADSVIIIAQGKKVFDGDFDELVEIDASDSVTVDATDRLALAQALTEAGYPATVLRSGVTVRGATTAQVGAVAAGAGVVLTALGRKGPSLEDIFLDLVSGARVQPPRDGVDDTIAVAEVDAVDAASAESVDATGTAEAGAADADEFDELAYTSDADGSASSEDDSTSPGAGFAGSGLAGAGLAGAGLAGAGLAGAGLTGADLSGRENADIDGADASEATDDVARFDPAEADVTDEAADVEDVARAEDFAADADANAEANSVDAPDVPTGLTGSAAEESDDDGADEVDDASSDATTGLSALGTESALGAAGSAGVAASAGIAGWATDALRPSHELDTVAMDLSDLSTASSPANDGSEAESHVGSSRSDADPADAASGFDRSNDSASAGTSADAPQEWSGVSTAAFAVASTGVIDVIPGDEEVGDAPANAGDGSQDAADDTVQADLEDAAQADSDDVDGGDFVADEPGDAGAEASIATDDDDAVADDSSVFDAAEAVVSEPESPEESVANAWAFPAATEAADAPGYDMGAEAEGNVEAEVAAADEADAVDEAEPTDFTAENLEGVATDDAELFADETPSAHAEPADEGTEAADAESDEPTYEADDEAEPMDLASEEPADDATDEAAAEDAGASTDDTEVEIDGSDGEPSVGTDTDDVATPADAWAPDLQAAGAATSFDEPENPAPSVDDYEGNVLSSPEGFAEAEPHWVVLDPLDEADVAAAHREVALDEAEAVASDEHSDNDAVWETPATEAADPFANAPSELTFDDLLRGEETSDDVLRSASPTHAAGGFDNLIGNTGQVEEDETEEAVAPQAAEVEHSDNNTAVDAEDADVDDADVDVDDAEEDGVGVFDSLLADDRADAFTGDETPKHADGSYAGWSSDADAEVSPESESSADAHEEVDESADDDEFPENTGSWRPSFSPWTNTTPIVTTPDADATQDPAVAGTGVDAAFGSDNVEEAVSGDDDASDHSAVETEVEAVAADAWSDDSSNADEVADGPSSNDEAATDDAAPADEDSADEEPEFEYTSPWATIQSPWAPRTAPVSTVEAPEASDDAPAAQDSPWAAPATQEEPRQPWTPPQTFSPTPPEADPMAAPPSRPTWQAPASWGGASEPWLPSAPKTQPEPAFSPDPTPLAEAPANEPAPVADAEHNDDDDVAESPTENPLAALIEDMPVIPESHDPSVDPDAFVDEHDTESVEANIVTVSTGEPNILTTALPSYIAPADDDAPDDTDPPRGAWERREDRTPADDAADEFFRSVGLLFGDKNPDENSDPESTDR